MAHDYAYPRLVRLSVVMPNILTFNDNIDIPHVPHIQPLQQRILALRTQRNSDTVPAVRVDTHRYALLAVDKDLDHALIHKDA